MLTDSCLARPSRGPKCTVCLALSVMDSASADTLRRWMADPTIPFTVISQTCRDDDDTPDLTGDSISRHARGQCSTGEGRLR